MNLLLIRKATHQRRVSPTGKRNLYNSSDFVYVLLSNFYLGPMTPLKIGRIPFLVCAPFFHSSLIYKSDDLIFEEGSPSHLNKLLSSGKIDISLSSSIAYAQNFQHLYLLPNYCISSGLEIKSVLLFSQEKIDNLDHKNIYLTQASESSVALLKILMNYYLKITPTYTQEQHVDCVGCLLIGDEALIEKEKSEWNYCYDLASLWQEWQKLPFVFALWMVRRDVFNDSVKCSNLEIFYGTLLKSITAFRTNILECTKVWLKKFPLPLSEKSVLNYFSTIDYSMKPDHVQSLEIFYQYCLKMGFIDEVPELYFIPSRGSWKGNKFSFANRDAYFEPLSSSSWPNTNS